MTDADTVRSAVYRLQQDVKELTTYTRSVNNEVRTLKQIVDRLWARLDEMEEKA